MLFTSIQSNKQTEKIDLELLSSDKWTMDYMIMEGQKIDMPTEKGQESWMIFHKYRKHEIMSIGEVFISNWEYIESNNSIRMFDRNGSVKQKVELLTKTELIFYYHIDDRIEKIKLSK
ncbi:MAG: hypothetical protein ACJAVA_002084 [Flavobacteriaceae bacterium]